MKTGLKFVVIVWVVDQPGNIRVFSNYKKACDTLEVNYNTFNHWKRAQTGEITIKNLTFLRKEIER
jgi:hypothetical protein